MVPRVLLLYATTDGHTRKVVKAMGLALEQRGAIVDIVEADRHGDEPDPVAYEAVIVAASIHAGGYQRSVQRWVTNYAPGLKSALTAFVTVCLGVLEHNPKTDETLRDILQTFLAKTRWTPTMTKTVAGALLYTQYGWLKRRIMRRIVAKAHGDTDMSRDYEYTDWDDVRRFTNEFCDVLLARTQPVRRTG